jgi:S-DNA-T family DNA segregation ATPase FtsK/SpoIIIE
MARTQQNRAVSEVLGLVLLGGGTLLLLALVSYTPRDLPSWFPLSQFSTPNQPPQNFIGLLGAIAASCCYFLIGAAAYLVAAAALGYGGALLVAPRIRISRRLPWVAAFILSAAVLLQMQPWFLGDWPKQMNVGGPGGWIGYWIWEVALKETVGRVGTAILFGLLYTASLVMMTGIQPMVPIRWLIRLPSLLADLANRYRMARADERERLALEQKRLEREAKRIARELNKKPKNGKTPSRAADDPAAPEGSPEGWEEAEERPEPQIIDASAAPPKAQSEKPAFKPIEPVHYENYQMPSFDLLDEADHKDRPAANPEELKAVQATMIETLAQFGIEAQAGDITRGPTITRYELYPAKGVRVDRIVSLERDLARATRAERINILAPIPGKDTVGIELANSGKVKVTLRELLESEAWHETKARIPLAIGKDVYGKTIIADLADMPHCLVAGTTGSGKSVCINAIVASLLYRFTPEEARFIMIDPKVVEMQIFNKLPHLVVPVVTDPKKVLLALRWVIDEMEKRYRLFAESGVKNIAGYNGRLAKLAEEQAAKRAAERAADEAEEETGEVVEQEAEREPAASPPPPAPPSRIPYIVVIIDELADLMQTAPADVEAAIARITQMARAAGIHLIVATQTPRADVVTGVIKANIPTRIAFQVASKIDSRVILDENGADRLLGKGDMLYLPPGGSRLLRAQGVLITEEEIHRLVEFVGAQAEQSFDAEVHERLESDIPLEEEVSEEDEELVRRCVEIMKQEKRASTSLFQRRLRLGYTRAARVVDILEQRGVLAPGEGARPREILVDLDTFEM